MSAEAILITAALAWCAIWINFVVINFINKSERLHKDYIATGQIDQTRTYIEATLINPVIKEIFDSVKSKIGSVTEEENLDIEEILQTYDYSGPLKRIEEGSNIKINLMELFNNQKLIARVIWKVCLTHIALVLIFTFLFISCGIDVWFYICIMLSSITFLLMIFLLFYFEHKSEQFRKIIEHHRVKQ